MHVTPFTAGGWLAFAEDQVLCIAVVAIIVFLATSTRRSAKRCPRCMDVNRPHAIYCAQCGHRLAGK